MSKNKNSIFLFVKGHKGKGAYEITDCNGTSLHTKVLEDLHDEQGDSLHQVHADWKTIIDGLNYIRDNRNKNSIPREPVIFIFTTYENIFDVAVHLKSSEKYKGHLDEINKLKSQLKRSFVKNKEDDNVRFHYIPENFENKMDNLKEILDKCSKIKPS